MVIAPPWSSGQALFGVFSSLLHVGFLVIVFVIAAGLLLLLVRFLLIATKAAQLYVDKNSVPAEPIATPNTTPGTPPEA
jgi:hypothetical protein